MELTEEEKTMIVVVRYTATWQSGRKFWENADERTLEGALLGACAARAMLLLMDKERASFQEEYSGYPVNWKIDRALAKPTVHADVTVDEVSIAALVFTFTTGLPSTIGQMPSVKVHIESERITFFLNEDPPRPRHLRRVH